MALLLILSQEAVWIHALLDILQLIALKDVRKYVHILNLRIVL